MENENNSWIMHSVLLQRTQAGQTCQTSLVLNKYKYITSLGTKQNLRSLIPAVLLQVPARRGCTALP